MASSASAGFDVKNDPAIMNATATDLDRVRHT